MAACILPGSAGASCEVHRQAVQAACDGRASNLATKPPNSAPTALQQSMAWSTASLQSRPSGSTRHRFMMLRYSPSALALLQFRTFWCEMVQSSQQRIACDHSLLLSLCSSIGGCELRNDVPVSDA